MVIPDAMHALLKYFPIAAMIMADVSGIKKWLPIGSHFSFITTCPDPVGVPTFLSGLFLRFKQFEELIQLRQDHDPGSAVCCFSFRCTIVGNWKVFSTTCSSHFCGVKSILFL